MFSLIESKEEIAKAQRKLEAAIRRDFKTKAEKNIGYPGGTTFDAEVVTDGNGAQLGQVAVAAWQCRTIERV